MVAFMAGGAERLPDRIRRLVYLDALILQAGQTPYSVLPAEVVAQRRASCISENGVSVFPPPPVTVFGIPEDHPEAAWVSSHLTPPRRACTTRPCPSPKKLAMVWHVLTLRAPHLFCLLWHRRKRGRDSKRIGNGESWPQATMPW